MVDILRFDYFVHVLLYVVFLVIMWENIHSRGLITCFKLGMPDLIKYAVKTRIKEQVFGGFRLILFLYIG